MSQFKLDADTGDLVRENGSFVRVTGAEEIAQHVRVKLRLIRGECFMDRTLGIRYFSEEQADGAVFAKGTSLPSWPSDGQHAEQVAATQRLAKRG